MATVLAGAAAGFGWWFSGQVLDLRNGSMAVGRTGAASLPEPPPDVTREAVPDPLGAMPAWLAGGRRATWVLFVHGYGATLADGEYLLPMLRQLGFPALLVSYRGDPGAPPESPPGHTHLGQTEWHDVAAAVAYARRRGARRVALVGSSMGAEMVLQDVRHSPAGSVCGVVLDSPVLDWGGVFTNGARRRGVPGPLAWMISDLGEEAIHLRAGVDFSELDQVAHAGGLHVPILLFQAGADTAVPLSVAADFARALPRLVTYRPVPGAGHGGEYQADPMAYYQALARFLARTCPG